MFYKNSSCAPLPDIYNLKFNNMYWQEFQTPMVTFQIYKAFFDNRNINGLSNSVHVLAMIDHIDLTEETFCQIWFEDQTEPVIVGTVMYKYIWYHGWGDPGVDKYGPYLVTCQLPDTHRYEPPACVSVVSNPCDVATNFLRVTYDVPVKKEEFAVCVKGLDLLKSDQSTKIVEWIELLDLMGVHKVFFYQLNVHPNIKKVLDYYVAVGKVDVTPITLPEGQPNIPILQHEFLDRNILQQCFDELIPYNDCFYRNIYSYEYVVLMDIDEIIMPVKDNNWTSLLKRVQANSEATRDKWASFNVQNVYFLSNLTPADSHPEIPQYMHMLRHTQRSSNFTDPYYYVKSFFDTNTVLTVHNHMPIEYANTTDYSYAIDKHIAQLNHYRDDCVIELDCGPFREYVVEDKLLWRNKDALMWRVNKVLSYLGLI